MENQGFWLSPQQEHVWSFEPEMRGATYRVQALVWIDGALDCERLHGALLRVVARQDILRTIFVRQPGMKVPFQVISEKAALERKTGDLTGLSDSEQNSRISDLFEREKEANFHLDSGPLLRAQLVKLTPRRSALILSLPALCGDAWTVQNFVGELSAGYSQDKPADDEPIPYVQFAQWQRDLLGSEDEQAREAKAYWQKQDLGSLAPPTLPAEPRSAAAFVPGKAAIEIDPDGIQQIEKLGARSQTQSSTVCLAAWHALLWRLSPQARILADTLFAGREYEEFKPIFGLLSRHLPIASRFDGNFRFEEVVVQLARTLRETAEHQEYFPPEALSPCERAVGFEFIDLGGPVEAGDVRMQIAQLYSCTEPCKIKLVVVRGAAGHALEFHYDRSRFGEEVISRLGAQFRMLLASAVAHPEKPIGELAILPAEERQRLLVEWNRTERAYPAGETMVSLFEAQAAKTPERIAVAGAGKQLTYAELNGRANQLAHALRGQGVGPDSGVGLCLDRSADLLVAILGIFKAGGAYVPLNPEHPRARLEQQLAGAKALVTESAWLESAGRALLSDLPAISGAVICLDRDADKLSQQPATNPAAVAKPENLAYVIYTSGSTGVPKGVEIEHRNLANYARFLAERLELEKYPEGLGFATVSTIAADLGNTCIYPALVSGGTLHLVSHDEATDTARLGRYMDEHGIDVLKIVPSHLSALLASEEGRKVLPRKYLITGGEALTQRLLDRIAQLQATCEVINHYGPTETTVGSLTLKLNEHAAGKWDSPAIPIGRPIANTRVYILDARLQPVPIGAVGELYISGAGVGRGYRGQPRMTAECFLQDPFADDPGARMYRTGDLARYLEDGNIEFLGRSDDQVKVRGFRIELGEIEAALASHASVKQAVVLAREDEQSGDKRLVGYAVLHREKPTTVEDLRQHLRTQLPDYMVPGALLILDKLPLNANGKVDRQGLPSPQAAGPANQRPYVAPRTPVEEVVTNIWAEVLRVPQVGADDNFFELGGHSLLATQVVSRGHSLLATQVVSRIREHFNVELALRSLFEKPTVNALASEIETVREGAAHSEPNPITRASRERYRITTNQG